MALTGWSPPAMGDSPLQDVSIDSLNDSQMRPGKQRPNWQAMALNAREVPPLPSGGNPLPLMDQMDIPFEDDETSIARTSNRSASELAILEAQMQLDSDLVQVAEAKARATCTRVFFLKAEDSRSSETKSLVLTHGHVDRDIGRGSLPQPALHLELFLLLSTTRTISNVIFQPSWMNTTRNKSWAETP